MAKRITKKAKKAMERVTLHLNEEFPRIGSGVRNVLVQKQDNKFVWLVYNRGNGDEVFKMSLKLFQMCRR